MSYKIFIFRYCLTYKWAILKKLFVIVIDGQKKKKQNKGKRKRNLCKSVYNDHFPGTMLNLKYALLNVYEVLTAFKPSEMTKLINYRL